MSYVVNHRSVVSLIKFCPLKLSSQKNEENSLEKKHSTRYFLHLSAQQLGMLSESIYDKWHATYQAGDIWDFCATQFSHPARSSSTSRFNRKRGNLFFAIIIEINYCFSNKLISFLAPRFKLSRAKDSSHRCQVPARSFTQNYDFRDLRQTVMMMLWWEQLGASIIYSAPQ